MPLCQFFNNSPDGDGVGDAGTGAFAGPCAKA